MAWLVTGGAGYIGSSTVLELLERGDDVVVIDDLSNSSAESLRRVTEISRREVPLVVGDVRAAHILDRIFHDYDIEAVIHFAGRKAVGESVEKPVEYYRTNIDSTLTLVEAMARHGVKRLVFSSSATVYGTPAELPLRETSRTGIGITNPYGWTKYMIEQMLRDLAVADHDWRITILRYFNPIGAHESGLLGEDPRGTPNNLLPFIAQVAVGLRDRLRVYGGDYDTPDGTGVRDYVHVTDLARGHIAAAQAPGAKGVVSVYNLGTGRGASVLEVVAAFEAASREHIPYELVPRRPGDVAVTYADVSLAELELGWRAEKTLQEACADVWRWQSANPRGYADIVE